MYKPKILLISNIPAPYWIYGSEWLRLDFDLTYLCYDRPSETGRPQYWDQELPLNFIICKDRLKIYNKYLDLKISTRIRELNPDLVILGGFAEILSNYIAYRHCKKNKIKCAMVSEIWRNRSGTPRRLLSYIVSKIFNGIDCFLPVGEHAVEYWSDFFPKEKLHLFRYPTFIDEYMKHPLRKKKNDLTLFFGHRLTEEYNPLMAIKILSACQVKYPKTSLLINSAGPLKDKILNYINENNVTNVRWIDIKSYSDLSIYYKNGDVSLSPCIYSNGNIGTLEASASGMPILISEHVHYHGKIINKFKNGFILKLSILEFVRKIFQYIEDDELLTCHSNRSKKSVMELNNNEFLKIFSESVKFTLKKK